MIIDVTGVILIPGNWGKDCPGNGENPENECCCDECNYMKCCFDLLYPAYCSTCPFTECPRAIRRLTAK